MQPKKLSIHHSRQLCDLALEAGWSFTLQQAQLFLSATDCALGYFDQEEELLATATLFPYSHGIATLGNVLVKEQYRRQGLGRRIVEECLASAEDPLSSTLLIATPLGYPLYQRLGFTTVGHVLRFVLENSPAESNTVIQNTPQVFSDGNITPLEREPGDALNSLLVKMDETTFGANRASVYHPLLAVIQAGRMFYNQTSQLTGFALATKRSDLLYVGPVIAEDAGVAEALICSIIGSWHGPVRVDVLHHQNQVQEKLRKLGFVQVQSSPLMVKGPLALPGQRNRYYGILDPALC